MEIEGLLENLVGEEIFVERIRSDSGSSISGAFDCKVSRVGEDCVILDVNGDECCIPFHAILLIAPKGKKGERRFDNIMPEILGNL
jgi:hypothetical protein